MGAFRKYLTPLGADRGFFFNYSRDAKRVLLRMCLRELLKHEHPRQMDADFNVGVSLPGEEECVTRFPC